MTSRFCSNPNSESSLLLQEGSGPYKDLLSDRTKYSYPYDNVYQANNDTVMFLNADEIVYVSADGEGSECGGGGSSFYNKFNLRTGAVETVAKGGSGYHCHDFTVANNESDYTNACYDGGETYAYKDVNLKFSVLCSDRLKTGSRTLTVTFNDKVVLTKTVPDSMDKPWSFLGTMNTVFLLLGKGHDLGFQAAGGYYSIDTATGRLVSTVG